MAAIFFRAVQGGLVGKGLTRMWGNIRERDFRNSGL